MSVQASVSSAVGYCAAFSQSFREQKIVGVYLPHGYSILAHRPHANNILVPSSLLLRGSRAISLYGRRIYMVARQQTAHTSPILHSRQHPRRGRTHKSCVCSRRLLDFPCSRPQLYDVGQAIARAVSGIKEAAGHFVLLWAHVS